MRKSLSLFFVACLVCLSFVGGRASGSAMVAIPRIKLQGFPDPNGDGYFAATIKTDSLGYSDVYFVREGVVYSAEWFHKSSTNFTTGLMTFDYMGTVN